MHLAVGAVAHAVGFCVVAHFLDVALKRVKIKDQARRLNIRFIHAGLGGDVKADLELFKIWVRVHFSVSFI